MPQYRNPLQHGAPFLFLTKKSGKQHIVLDGWLWVGTKDVANCSSLMPCGMRQKKRLFIQTSFLVVLESNGQRTGFTHSPIQKKDTNCRWKQTTPCFALCARLLGYSGFFFAPKRKEKRSEKPFTIVTWLILPVVICLSQRLSHACLSINNFILWNCEWLIKSVIVYLIVLTTWITVVILELIHAKKPDFWKGCIY